MKRPRPFRLPLCAAALVAAACSGATARSDAAGRPAATATVEAMPTPPPAATKPAATKNVPPIDAEVPAAYRTATFALG